MRKFSILLAALVIPYFSGAQTKQDKKLSFLHTSGQDIVNESGKKIFLKGVGLGNWMLPEGYMWKFGAGGDRPRKIEKVVADIIGPEKAREFWSAYRKNYITETDIKRIAELGFNSVRPAMNARLFLTEGPHPEFMQEGFQLLDSLVSWCRKYKIYVILDMHAAPGGQTGANIDDSQNNSPDLFVDPKFQDQLVELWVKLADRYKAEPVVAAYDLLNEPLPKGTGAADKYKDQLVPVYKRITAAIRNIDTKHMITLEGFDWANDWSLFDKPFDKNVFYQFHFYCWAKPDHLGGIDQYLRKRTELNTPVWVGETGEKGNTIYWGTSQYFIANNIGFSFWPWKKMDTRNTPYSIQMPEGWDQVIAYTKGGTRPDSTVGVKIFREMLENIKLEHCVFFGDVCNAVLTRVPGKIEAENYGHHGPGRSYFVTDTSFRSKWYRTNEPVRIELDSKEKDPFWSDQSVEMRPAEWLEYNFDCATPGKYTLALRVFAGSEPVKVSVMVNDRKADLTVSNKDFMEIKAGVFSLKSSGNKIRVRVLSGTLRFDWLKFE